MSFLGVDVEPFSDLDLVTAQEAADHVGVSRSLVYYWASTKKLKHVTRHAGVRLYRRRDVVALDADQRANRLSSRYDLEPTGA